MIRFTLRDKFINGSDNNNKSKIKPPPKQKTENSLPSLKVELAISKGCQLMKATRWPM